MVIVIKDLPHPIMLNNEITGSNEKLLGIP